MVVATDRIHTHTLIGKFVRDYRKNIEPSLKQGRDCVDIRKHFVSAQILGWTDGYERWREKIDFEKTNEIAGGIFLYTNIVLFGMREGLSNGRICEEDFLDVKRRVAEIEFMLNEDENYLRGRYG